MPFKSQAQRRFLYSQHPEIAREFQAKTPSDAQLPERKGAIARRLRRYNGSNANK